MSIMVEFFLILDVSYVDSDCDINKLKHPRQQQPQECYSKDINNGESTTTTIGGQGLEMQACHEPQVCFIYFFLIIMY